LVAARATTSSASSLTGGRFSSCCAGRTGGAVFGHAELLSPELRLGWRVRKKESLLCAASETSSKLFKVPAMQQEQDIKNITT
jgi:hypothetical protein